MSRWLLWGAVLLLQNASFTWTSRARNSGSWKYNFVASIFSNGIWWIGQFFAVSIIVEATSTNNVWLGVGGGIYYTLLCASSSAAMQAFLMRYVEKGKRLVGAR